MASKIVTTKQKQAEQIKEAIRTHGGVISDALQAKAARRGAALTAVQTLLQFAHDAVDDALTQAADADAAHEAELADDHAPREARDAAAETLRGNLVDLRRTTATLYGDRQVKTLAFPAEIPRDPALVERVALDVLGALRKGPLPAPLLVGISPVSTDAWIGLLEAGLDALTTARADVTRETQEARATQTAKDRTSAALTDAMVAAAQLTVSLARLAGTPELVAGLRGTIFRGAAKGANDDAEDAPANDDTTDAEPVADAAKPAEPVTPAAATPKPGASVPPAAPKGGAATKPRAAAARRKR
jgi:hypothetical protein